MRLEPAIARALLCLPCQWPVVYDQSMRRIFTVLVLLGCLALVQEARADQPATTGRLIKVLPLLLNKHGNDAVSPSLFDRDAYQSYLRLHTNEIAGMRFDVLWKASGGSVTNGSVKIQVELRTVAPNGDPRLETLEKIVPPDGSRHWTTLPLTPDDYKQFGDVVAWRTTLWAGDRLLSEQKSFLW